MKQRTREHNLSMMQKSGPSIKIDQLTDILRNELPANITSKILAIVHKQASNWGEQP